MPGIEVRPAAAMDSNVPRPGEDRVELLEQRIEIEIRIRLDPVKFSVRPSDLVIKTHCNRISYAPH
jgi:hypothetical protein